MRVIAGIYRGKKLYSPADNSVRPTTDRIKETFFNVIQFSVPGARVLDLFAGTGALGIECLSRGAAEVVFADKSRDSLELTRKNLEGITGNFRIVPGDFMSALRSCAGKYDVIFIDPPYKGGLGVLALEAVFALDILAEKGIIVYEHASDDVYTLTADGYKNKSKRMGTVSAEFITRKSVALMAGSFDPITRGHESVLDEALRRFDEVIVACLINPEKRYCFNAAQRLALVEKTVELKKGAKALYSEKDATEVAEQIGACALVRGVRGDADRAYEDAMAEYNLQRGFKTVFIEPDCVRNVSSTVVREQIRSGNFSGVPCACVPLLQSDEFKNLK